MRRKAAIRRAGALLAIVIVVAFVGAVLQGCSNGQSSNQSDKELETRREATDLANIRSAYAELTAAYLTDDLGDDASIEIPVTQTQANWQIDGDTAITLIAEGHRSEGVEVPSKEAGEGVVYVVSVDEDGVITVG